MSDAMSLIGKALDSLPYIDLDPSEEDRARIQGLIEAELPKGYRQTPHPSLPPLHEPKFSPLVQKELDRVTAGMPFVGGIEMSRYDPQEAPSNSEDIDAWRAVLRNAYASSEHVSIRHDNLKLLEEFGNNAWLIGNSQLEQILSGLENELVQLKADTDAVNKERKAAQEDSRGELIGLEETWRRGVSKMIELQVATDGVRQEILERRRDQAH